MGKISKKVQERRLKWCGHVAKRDVEYSRNVMAVEVQGRRKRRRGRLSSRWMERVKDKEE